jgi:hypothetical protein
LTFNSIVDMFGSRWGSAFIKRCWAWSFYGAAFQL